METIKAFSEEEKKLMNQAVALMTKLRMANTTKEQRVAAAKKANIASLKVRRANAERRKAEKDKA